MRNFRKQIFIGVVSLLFTSSSFAWTTPTLSSPSSGSSAWTGLTLDWNAVSGSQQYQLQVDTSSAFDSPVLINVTNDYINSSSGNSDTQYYLDDLYFGKTYFWRVRAYIDGDTSSWSSPWNFTTRDYVTLSSPTTGSNSWTGLTLDWSAHAGVDFYDFEADTTTLFNSSALHTTTNAYINSSSGNSDTQFYLDDLYFGKTYYWRVRARNAVDTSSWSSVWDFTTRDYVTLSSPTTGSNSWTGLTLDWSAHAGVDYYDFEADTTTLFNSLALHTTTNAYINSSSGNGDTQFYLDDLYFGKTYYWRVRARNAVDTSSWSSVWDFTTRDYVTLNSPADSTLNVNTNGITLDWSAHAGIDTYQLQMDTIDTFNSLNLVTVDNAYINSSSGNSDTQHSTGALDSNQTYYWRVRAINAVDTSLWSARVFSTGSIITGINQKQTGNLAIVLFPNPCNSELTIFSQQPLDNASIKLYNSIGLIILEKDEIFGGTFSFDVSRCVPGIYFLKMVEKDRTTVKRILKL